MLNGRGSVDVAIERKGFSLACEITVTTTTEHEIGNLEKCLMAGFSLIAAVSTDPARLEQIATMAAAKFSPNQRERIRYLSPDEVMVMLQAEAMQLAATAQAPQQSETARRGYRVRRTYVSQNAEEAKASEGKCHESACSGLQEKIEVTTNPPQF